MKTIYDVDFSQLYRQHKQLAARPSSTAEQWDSKAQDTKIGNLASPYVTALLGLMRLKPTDSLLDVGCGAGAVAVLAAPLVKQVYGLDFSKGMLQLLQANAQHYGAHNIKSLCKGWGDDWQDVPQCDVVVASRSTLVDDMQMALVQLNQKAKRHVYLTYPAKLSFASRATIDPQQQPELATPSYLYIIAILHQLGIQAQLRFLNSKTGQIGTSPEADWAVIDWQKTLNDR